MPPSSNPAVVICHGLYHSPALYLPLITALQAVGIEAYCPQLPTSDLTKLNVGNVDHPSFDLGPPKGGYPQGEQEIETINGVLKPLLAQGKSIILLGHSAGGWTATQAAKKEFQAKERARQDLAGGIVGILYVGAFIIPVGESVNSFFQPEDGAAVVPPFMKFHAFGVEGLGTIVKAETFLFNDLDVNEAQKWATKLTAAPILTTRLTNEDVYSSLPCAYLVLEGDLTLPKEYQEGMVAAQVAKSEVPFTMYSSPAGHSPHLSWTTGMVDVIQKFAHTAAT